MNPTHELLGRLVPPDFEHVEKYNARTIAAPSPTNVVFGINWYDSFFTPKLIDGKSVIASGRNWGRVAGGHAIRALRKGYVEANGVSVEYDQRKTPRCVGYSSSAELNDMTGLDVDPDQTYRDAQALDSIPGTNYDGTELRAAFDAFRKLGPALKTKGGPIKRGPKIAGYYWCTSEAEVSRTLGYGDGDDFKALHQTWHASGYPDVIWLPRSAVPRLLRENGECGFMQLAA
jgi:hypothetical protein